MADDAIAERQASAPEFEDGPRLELDQLLTQLVDRAQDVIAAQGRLRGLLAANKMIIGDLELPVVLRRITEAACQLVRARYGALGVLAPGGGLQEFVHVGIDDETAKLIGPLPSGKGLLGALIDDPRPIRLRTMSEDIRSVGFPRITRRCRASSACRSACATKCLATSTWRRRRAGSSPPRTRNS
jgi:hypothetical protein